jgi:hypothetical protein
MGGGALRFQGDVVPAAGLIHDPTQGGRALLVTPEGTFAKAFGPWVFLRLVLVGAALLSLLGSLLFAVFWVPRALFGNLKASPDLRMRAFPTLAALVLGEWLLLWARSSAPLGTLNLTTFLLAFLGLVFAALALTGLLEALFAKAKASPPPSVTVPGGPAIQVQIEGVPAKKQAAPALSGAGRAVRVFCLTTSLLAVFLVCELAAFGLLGVRTWR